jgi:ABC-type multidrug transport system fused ATPase/permease subunit
MDKEHINLIFQIWNQITFYYKIKYLLALILSLFSILIEFLSVLIFFPFVSIILTNTIVVKTSYSFSFIDEIIKLDKIYIYGLFVSIILISALLRAAASKMTVNVCYSIGNNLMTNAYEKLLNQDYLFYKTINSNEVIVILTNKISNIVNTVFVSLITSFSNIILIFIISAFIFYTNPILTILLLFSFSLFYLFLGFYNSSKIDKDSTLMSSEIDYQVKVISESLGYIKNIIIENSSAMFINMFKRSISLSTDAQVKMNLRGLIPRYLIEFILFFIFSSFAYFISNVKGVESPIVSLSIVIYSSFKIIPLIQILYVNWVGLKGSKANLTMINSLLCLKPRNKKFNLVLSNFKHLIEFKNVNFSYPNNSNFNINNLSFEIQFGDKVGLFSPSGTGKSTLIDILMGLLAPNSGNVLVDGLDVNLNETNNNWWKSQISIVPQKIFLFNNSILFNICLVNDYELVDLPFLNKVIDLCELNFVHQFEDGLDTQIGESGSRLSGGQAQRIGIARVLYLRKPIIVMDEALNSCDEFTENKIMNNLINYQGKTIIFISHNADNKKYCNKLIEI